MSNEIRATAALTVTIDSYSVGGSKTNNITMTGSHYSGNSIAVGTSSMALPTGSVDNVRYFFLKNISTASIDVAINSASQSFACLAEDDVLLLPGTASVLTYYIRASQGPANVQYTLVER
jgi:hypothetical protein